ncbi:hypothetical protein ABZ478_36815 [Streptomyces sp. NPDC005706]|uniref:hypothetical protein n=1 Tax=Streptomyces sp. NPDC005706 TaxID=3157169 RepID=UPI0034036F45
MPKAIAAVAGEAHSSLLVGNVQAAILMARTTVEATADTFHFQAGIGQRSSTAYFGTAVLTGLVNGMDEFLTDPTAAGGSTGPSASQSLAVCPGWMTRLSSGGTDNRYAGRDMTRAAAPQGGSRGA